MKTWNRWDLEAEYQLIELRVTGKQYGEIAEIMGRSLDSIKKKAAQLQKAKSFADWADEYGISF